jgi:HIP---CoA ligase
MFIVGGFNAYPAEIEGFMLKHPAVAQVAVIGVPDERLGQVAWCRGRMAGFKAPRYVEFLGALPPNATGKVMKDQLR